MPGSTVGTSGLNKFDLSFMSVYHFEWRCEHRAERHKTIILLRASTGPKPPEVARGQRRGSLGPHLGPNNFGPSERNKIKILLRSVWGYDIIYAYRDSSRDTNGLRNIGFYGISIH